MNFDEQVPNPFAFGGDTAKFVEIGDSVSGTIVKLEHRAQTDGKGNVVRFSDGTPKPVVVVHLETASGQRARDSVSPRAVSACREAVHRVHGPGTSPEVGAYYCRKLVRLEPPSQRGWSPAKIYEIEYVPRSNGGSDERELV